MDPTHLKLAGAGGAIVAVVVGLAIYSSGDGAPTSTNEASETDPVSVMALEEWSRAGSGESIAVAVGLAGPAFSVGELELVPTPVPEGAQVEWSTSRSDTRSVITGEGTLDGARVRFVWELERGDPQARLTWSLEGVPLARLARPIEASWALPGGSVEVLGEDLKVTTADSEVALDAWTPLRARWSDGSDTQSVSISSVGPDVTTLSPSGDGFSLGLTLWSPEAHPPLAGCAGEEGVTPTVGLRGELVVTFGDARVAAPMRAPAGRVASLAPVFTDPRRHPDKLLRRGAPDDPQDWVDRVTTLAMGHSSPDEARFGNGGLVGLELGGVIVTRHDWLDGDPARALAERIGRTRVELASDSAADPSAPVATFAPEAPGCSDWLATWPDDRDALVLSFAELPSRPRTLDALDGAPIGLAPDGALAHLDLPLIDGGRGPLSADVFSEARLAEHFDARGVGWFAAPLVSTRNPLDASSTEGLLEPERRGEWTIAPELTAALATVELLDERRDLLVTSPRLLLAYWERARRVSVRELPNGDLALYNDGPSIPGFSLLVEGSVTGRAADEETSRKELDAHGESQTLLWWDLPSGPSRVALDAPAEDARLSPVMWDVSGP